jgi:hypothetical protein
LITTDADNLEPVLREIMPLSDLETALWSNDARAELVLQRLRSRT